MITIVVVKEGEEIKLNLDELQLYDKYKRAFPDIEFPGDGEVVEYYVNKHYPDNSSFWILYA